MENPLNEYHFSANGKQLVMRGSNMALLNAERSLGINLFLMIEKAATHGATFDISQIVIIMQHFLKAGMKLPQLPSEEEVCEILDEVGPLKMATEVTKLIMNAYVPDGGPQQQEGISGNEQRVIS